MLDIQYRMPRQIGYLISKFIYGGKLKNPTFSMVLMMDKMHNIPLLTKHVNVNGEEVPNSIIAVTTSGLEKPYDNDNKINRN